MSPPHPFSLSHPPRHKAQAIHYLTATGYKLAILLNFGTPSLDHERIVK